jgi:hypothetical protein
MRIGELSARSQVNIQTLRFYEREGLLRAPLRTVWIATVAMLVIVWQVALGLMLRNPSQPQRRALRRTHFWTMMLVAGLIVAHVFRNRQ